MKKSILTVGVETIRPGAGPCTGDIWIEMGSEAFPMQGWNDFIIVILEAFASALVRILRRVSTVERVYFMEGPYAIDICLIAPNMVRVRAIADRHRERAVLDTETLVLIENLLQVCQRAITACRGTACWSQDAERLEALLPVLHGYAETEP